MLSPDNINYPLVMRCQGWKIESAGESGVLIRHPDDSAPNQQGGRRCGRGNVQNVQRVSRLHKLEIIDQNAIAPESLGANPGAAGDQIFIADCRDESLQGANEGCL